MVGIPSSGSVEAILGEAIDASLSHVFVATRTFESVSQIEGAILRARKDCQLSTRQNSPASNKIKQHFPFAFPRRMCIFFSCTVCCKIRQLSILLFHLYIIVFLPKGCSRQTNSKRKANK